MRLKPRLNPDVNDHWMCDIGRYDYHFIDENRILSPQHKGKTVSWLAAVDTISKTIQSIKSSDRGDRIAVLASAKLTNEDLFAVRKLFKDTLKTSYVDYRMPLKPVYKDHFLIRTDKNPNTAGAMTILEITDPPGLLAGQGQEATQAIIQKARKGEFDIFYVFGHNLVDYFGKDTVEQIAKHVKLFVFQGTNVNDTCSYAHLNLPSAVYAEKQGTFTNVQGRVQQIWPAFMPLGESKSDWEILALLSATLGTPFTYKAPQDIFKDIAATVAAFAEMSYEKIADQGMILKK